MTTTPSRTTSGQPAATGWAVAAPAASTPLPGSAEPATGSPASSPPPAGTQPPAAGTRWGSLWRGRPGDPAWVRPALLALLAGTGLLYLWGLGASGWANSFYSAAAQAGSASWKAFFFGSSDAGNSITVDKTPASLWVMALSVRMFGLSSWSVLVPQALAGVAAVGVLYATVRRWFTPAAGLIAGAALALTPVAVLMFRFNNPDALLVLLLVLAAYATVRAIERAGTRWLVIAGALVGAGFMTKMLQALLVVPALALAYLVAAPTGLRRRITQLLLAGAAMVAAGGWWVLVVQLIPASMRPYIGGSQHNSVLELALGYNGFGRLTGNETGSVGGGPGGGWGATGWDRMFGSEIGGQVSWLLPAALVMLGIGLWLTRKMPRTDRTRAAFLLWGGWLLVTDLLFSYMQGIFHPYYTVALAPAIGALVAMGSAALWRIRSSDHARYLLAGTLLLTVAWAAVLLGRSPDWYPQLRVAIVLLGVLAAAGLVLGPRLAPRLLVTAVGLGLVASLAGPAAYAVDTAGTPHRGAIPSAGPTVAGGGFGPGGGFARRGGFGNGPGGFGNGQGGLGAGPGGGFGPGGQVGPQGGTQGGIPGTQGGTQGQGGFGGPGGGFGGRGGGGMGGLLDGSTPSAQLVALLDQNAGQYTWVAAVVGSNNASGYQLATGRPVMPIGGFNGSDPSPTLAQFEQYVAQGRIHYFVGGGGFGSNGGSSDSSRIASWVAEHFSASTVGGVTVYDLTTQAGSADSGTTMSS